MRLKSQLIPSQNWTKYVKFVENTRTGTYAVSVKNRINLCDKSYFHFTKDLFNSLPKVIRNELHFNIYKSLIFKHYNCFN